jgi:hypothetical protein
MEKKENWFVRTLIIILGLLIMSLIIYNFFIIEPKGDITKELIILLCLLIILSLSEIFDSFSLGQFLTLKKEIKTKKERVIELKDEKKNLLNLLINNVSVQNQSQNIGISPSELKEIIKVIQADPDKVLEEDEEKQKESESLSEKEEISTKPNRRRLDFRATEKLGLDKFISLNNLDEYESKNQIQLSSNDPISSRIPIYDGYIKTELAEIFIEVKLQRSNMIFDNLYNRLHNIYNYHKKRGGNAYLQLILIEFPEDKENSRIRNSRERIEKDFAPAISKGLLKIHYFKLSDKEANKVYK